MNKVILENLEKKLKDVEESFTGAFKNMQKSVDELKRQIEQSEEKLDMAEPYLVEGCYIELRFKENPSIARIRIFERICDDIYHCNGFTYPASDYDYKVLGTPWDFAPDWAEWVVVDEDKCIYFYDYEPDVKDSYWDADGGIKASCGYDYTCKDWKNSKRKRPKWAKRRGK